MTKTQVKHTPGPWKVAHGLDILDVSVENMAGSLAICNITDSDDTQGVLADAHLIAAAPDLLEPCQQAVEFMGGLNSESFESDPAGVECALANTLAALNAALEKAGVL